ncbi:MAG: inosine monophosphate cyclohydrolase [Deltaproteobacteria bacterium]|nr:inosine monophosphate cyclohydrolase [Deltaproteobacteria bacterium]
MSTVRALAQANFARHLEANAYPGRGLVLGRAESGDAWLQVYWIMGRSENSRNRVFVADGGELRTDAANPALVKDPSLIIYEAMLELPGVYLVSNGDQTRTLADVMESGGRFEDALEMREREPDAPNYTPRISGMLDLRLGEPVLALSILRANAADPALTDRSTFRPAPPPPGFGLGLTTYQGDGNPLPAFQGDPLWLPCAGSAQDVADAYWAAIDRENRVALAVKSIHRDGRSEIALRNRFARS